jgi:hypothetical protein
VRWLLAAKRGDIELEKVKGDKRRRAAAPSA